MCIAFDVLPPTHPFPVACRCMSGLSSEPSLTVLTHPDLCCATDYMQSHARLPAYYIGCVAALAWSQYGEAMTSRLAKARDSQGRLPTTTILR